MSSETLSISSSALLGMEDVSLGSDFFEKLLNLLYDGVYFVDTQRRILFWNDAAERLTGYTKEEMLGSYCFDNILNHTDGQGNQLCINGCPLLETIAGGAPVTARVYLLHKDQRRIAVDIFVTSFTDEQNKIIGAIEIFRDASNAVALEKAYAFMLKLAKRDHLTGVANRRQMDTTIDDQLALFKRTGSPFTIVATDIDNFKEINDTQGHAVGDRALVMFANLIKQQRRSTDLFARMGGDEFLLLLRQQHLAEGVQTAERLRKIIESYQSEKLQGIKLSASFGVTEVDLEDTSKTLLHRADRALYKAKQTGRNRVESI